MTKFLLDTCTLTEWATYPKLLKDEVRIAIEIRRRNVGVMSVGFADYVDLACDERWNCGWP